MFNDQTEIELQTLIANAKAQLDSRTNSKRKEVIAEIKALAASINVHVEFSDKQVSKVSAKYCDKDTGEIWTGRGLMPLWLKNHIESGKSKDDFLI